MNELDDKQVNFLLGILKGVEVRGNREQVAKVSAEIEAIEAKLRGQILERHPEVRAMEAGANEIKKMEKTIEEFLGAPKAPTVKVKPKRKWK